MSFVEVDPKDRDKPSALIVDDEVEFCNLLTLLLEKTKLFSSVVSANNVFFAQKKILNQPFDLLIVDFLLGNRDGITLISNLNKMGRLRKTQIILISGNFGTQEVLDALSVGVKHILVKPFANQVLINKIHEVLQIRKKE